MNEYLISQHQKSGVSE